MFLDALSITPDFLSFFEAPMSVQVVSFDRFFPAPSEQVFEQFADHSRFGELWGLKVVRIRASKDPVEPNGAGSVRRVPSPLGAFEETVLSFVRGQRIAYTVSRGGPIKDHLGQIAFTPAAGGTRVHYTIRFSPRIPFTGALIAAIVRRDFNRGADRVSQRWRAA